MKNKKDAYLEKANSEIQDWENRKPGFLANAGELIVKPIEKAAAKLVPAKIQSAVASGIETSLKGASQAATWTVDSKKLTLKRKSNLKGKRNLGAKLQACDDLAKECWHWNVGYAVAEGAATGAPGWPGLIADIPALMTIACRVIQEIGLCYGFIPSSPEEKEYALQILRTGSAADIKIKMESILFLKQTEQVLLKLPWKKMSQEFAAKQMTKGAMLAGIRQFAKSLGVQITKRKALQMIPILGAVIGASFNGTYVNDIARAAYMSYRRRFIAGPDNSSALVPISG